jgi:chemotaxis protein methyltransferase CheR
MGENLYDETRLRELPAEALLRYFRQEGGHCRLMSRRHDTVRFERHNIMPAVASPAADLVLCRNVLSYFSRTEQEWILQWFTEGLSSFGALLLKCSETLVGEVRKQFRSEYPVVRIYRRMVGQRRIL